MDGKTALKFYPRLLDIIDFYLGKGERPEWLNEPDEEVEAA
ncbi:TPA: pentapeptide repeat-containing protein, partial [Yersinia enterocolitica]|nr:pentapeptide repeat-containing protein [Yersinia enterocolitica]